jgi:hypothetical protein
MEVMKVVNVLRQRALIKGGREAAQWMAAGRNWTPLWDRQAPDAVLESAASRIGRSAGRVSAGARGRGGRQQKGNAGGAWARVRHQRPTLWLRRRPSAWMYALLRRHQPRPCARRLLTTPAALSCPPRTHTCGALGPADAGKRVVLAGWLLPERCAHTRCMHDATGGDMAACAGRCPSGCRSSPCATRRGRRSSRSTARPTARSRRCPRARSSPPCSSRARSGCGPRASAAPCVPSFLSTAPVFIPAPGSRREHRGARRCRDAAERCGTAAALLRV